MSDQYTKLFSSITESTIWSEPAGTRLVWITMLAKCNRHGEVFGSVPGLARLANVTMDECLSAIETLLSPDRWSRTPDHEGRRIEGIDGGWRILNHAKFDKMRSEIEASERERERKARWDRENRGNRPSARNRTPDLPPTPPDVTPTNSDAPPTPSPTTDEEHGVSLARELAVQAAIEMRKHGIRVTPSNPDLIDAVSAGVTLTHLSDTAKAYPGKSAGYVIAVARREHTDGSKPISQGASHANRNSRSALSAADRVAIINAEAARCRRIIDVEAGGAT